MLFFIFQNLSRKRLKPKIKPIISAIHRIEHLLITSPSILFPLQNPCPLIAVLLRWQKCFPKAQSKSKFEADCTWAVRRSVRFPLTLEPCTFFPATNPVGKYVLHWLRNSSSSSQHIKIIFSHFSSLDFVTRERRESLRKKIGGRCWQSVGKVVTVSENSTHSQRNAHQSQKSFAVQLRERKMRLQREASK